MNWDLFWGALGGVSIFVVFMVLVICCALAWMDGGFRTPWRVVLFFRWVPLVLFLLGLFIGIPLAFGFGVLHP